MRGQALWDESRPLAAEKSTELRTMRGTRSARAWEKLYEDAESEVSASQAETSRRQNVYKSRAERGQEGKQDARTLAVVRVHSVGQKQREWKSTGGRGGLRLDDGTLLDLTSEVSGRDGGGRRRAPPPSPSAVKQLGRRKADGHCWTDRYMMDRWMDEGWMLDDGWKE